MAVPPPSSEPANQGHLYLAWATNGDLPIIGHRGINPVPPLQ
jgi:hypothetical protein